MSLSKILRVDLIFFIAFKFSSAEEIIREFVFSWCVITVLVPSDSLTKVLAIELSMGATSAAFAYFK